MVKIDNVPSHPDFAIFSDGRTRQAHDYPHSGICHVLGTGLEVVVVGCLWFVQCLFAGRESFGI